MGFLIRHKTAGTYLGSNDVGWMASPRCLVPFESRAAAWAKAEPLLGDASKACIVRIKAKPQPVLDTVPSIYVTPTRPTGYGAMVNGHHVGEGMSWDVANRIVIDLQGVAADGAPWMRRKPPPVVNVAHGSDLSTKPFHACLNGHVMYSEADAYEAEKRCKEIRKALGLSEVT